MGTVITILVVSYIISLFFGAGGRFIRMIGNALAAIVALITNLIFFVLLTLTIALIWGVVRFFRRRRLERLRAEQEAEQAAERAALLEFYYRHYHR